MATINSERFRTLLARLEAAAARDDDLNLPALPADATPGERADLMAEAYLPISPEAGHLMYALTRSARPTTVVEFGTSYGISTLHLAAAVRDNGVGHVISTELSAVKVAAARANLASAGLANETTIFAGDARETYLDYVREPANGYLSVHFPVGDGMEVSCRV